MSNQFRDHLGIAEHRWIMHFDILKASSVSDLRVISSYFINRHIFIMMNQRTMQRKIPSRFKDSFLNNDSFSLLFVFWTQLNSFKWLCYLWINIEDLIASLIPWNFLEYVKKKISSRHQHFMIRRRVNFILVKITMQKVLFRAKAMHVYKNIGDFLAT